MFGVDPVTGILAWGEESREAQAAEDLTSAAQAKAAGWYWDPTAGVFGTGAWVPHAPAGAEPAPDPFAAAMAARQAADAAQRGLGGMARPADPDPPKRKGAGGSGMGTALFIGAAFLGAGIMLRGSKRG